MNNLRHFLTGVRINKVIQYLAYSDIIMMSGWGLISPIIAVFFTEQVEGGDIALAGLSATVFFLVKSVLQIPIARWIDVRKGEKDDFYVLLVGVSLISLCAFLYIGVYLPWHVIAIQALFGLANALYYPAWLAIFTRHVDRNEEGLEWSMYFAGADFTGALTAGLGGLIVSSWGYQVGFLVMGLTSVFGGALLLGIASELKRK
ncbi:MAG: MFS transporter [Candidatus Doudnabacteria bacterium]|nr:MFS transporter [Candidatus Doudnabacteria bacterium]